MTSISIVDSNGNTLLGPITLASLQVSLPSPLPTPGPQVGVSYTCPVKTSGGAPPYALLTDSTWLKSNSAGTAVSGIPPTADTESHIITVSDQTGATASVTLTLTVAAAGGGSGGGGGGGGGPTPPASSTAVTKILGFQSFDKGTIGKTPTASNATPAVAWNLNDGGNPNSAISAYSADYLPGGFTTVMKQLLTAGQATPTWGSGWDYGLNSSQNGPLVAGDEAWISMMLLFPTGFSFATNDGWLKWMRINTQTTGQKNVGYNDILWGGNGTWINNFEGNAQMKALDLPNTHAPALGKWETYDLYVKLGTTPQTGLVRYWKNKQQIGADVPFQTLVNPTDQSVMAFCGSTYWNGGNAKAQSVYTAMTAIAVNSKASGRQDVQYLTKDSNGKPLIALGF